MKCSSCLVAVAATLSCQTVVAFDVSSYDVVLATDDTKQISSITNGIHWNPTGVPDSGKTYFVPSGLSIYTPQAVGYDISFAGDELAVAGQFYNVGKEDTHIDVPQLRMFHGSTMGFINVRYAGRRFTGNLTVDPDGPATKNNYVSWRPPKVTTEYVEDMAFDLIGSKDSRIVIVAPDLPSPGVGYNFAGDNTLYQGTLEAGHETSILQIGASDLPGTVKVSKGVLRQIENVRNTVASLDFASGTRLESAIGASFRVTNSFACATDVVLDISGLTMRAARVATRAALTNDVVALESDVAGALDETTFVIKNSHLYPDVQVGVVEDADGVRTLRAVTLESVQLPAERSQSSSWVVTKETFDSAEAGKDYWVRGDDYVSMISLKDGVFRGETLCLSSVLNFVGTSAESTGFYAKNLYLVGTTKCNLYNVNTFFVRGKGAYYLRGGITVDPEYAGEWLCRSTKLLYVESELSGGGDLKICSVDRAEPAETRYVIGYCELAGLNTNFTGRIKTYSPYTGSCGSVPVPSKDVMLTLYVTDGRNLGGPLDVFAYDALTLSGWSKLAATNSIALNQTNRGVFVDGNGQVEIVEDATMALMNPLTLNGSLLKRGAGTLALGGELRFGDGEATTVPATDENVIEVSEGWVKPLATNSFDGAALVFGTGAGLRLDVAPMADGLQARGLVNVKANGSIGLAEGASGDIALAFDGEIEKDTVLGVATLPTKAKAEAFRALLKPVRPRGFSVTLSVVENDDGTATVCADVSRRGFMILFK